MSATKQKIVYSALINTDLSFTNSNYFGCNLDDSDILTEIPVGTTSNVGTYIFQHGSTSGTTQFLNCSGTHTRGFEFKGVSASGPTKSFCIIDENGIKNQENTVNLHMVSKKLTLDNTSIKTEVGANSITLTNDDKISTITNSQIELVDSSRIRISPGGNHWFFSTTTDIEIQQDRFTPVLFSNLTGGEDFDVEQEFFVPKESGIYNVHITFSASGMGEPPGFLTIELWEDEQRIHSINLQGGVTNMVDERPLITLSGHTHFITELREGEKYQLMYYLPRYHERNGTYSALVGCTRSL